MLAAGCSPGTAASSDIPDVPDIPDIPEPPETYSLFEMPDAQEGTAAIAFPGAIGGGRNATGGRGGKVFHVTSLEDNAREGTLRYAVSQSGARTVVFDVAGTIALSSSLKIANGDITIAGQTAPGDGICLKGHSLVVNASNVIIRFIRCRMGDETATEDDALSASHKDSNPCRDIIIDHCSVSWSTDECASFYGNTDFTLQYCILSESLRYSVHDKGKHGYCGLWGGNNAVFHHNLLAHHDSRNPRFDHDYLCTKRGPMHFVNNVIYNWGANSGYGGESWPDVSPRQINIIGNYYKPGPASTHRTRIVNPTTKCSNCNSSDQYAVTPGKFYLSGNVMEGSSSVTSDNSLGVEPDDESKKQQVLSQSIFGDPGFTPESAVKAYEKTLALAGASLKRDTIDRRIVRETKEGVYTFRGSKGSTGGLIDSQADTEGWPEYRGTTVVDSDSDGIPDSYETLFGLDPRNGADALTKTLDKHARYTNLEMYLHYLVRKLITTQYQ